MLMIKKIVFLVCMFIPVVSFNQERTIKPGDALQIFVTGNEELNQTVVVSPDGTIDFPALQGFPVDGISLQKFQEILIAQLSRHMENVPLVLVRFSENYPVRLTILGQIARPGLISIPNTSTLQGAIAAAGGFIPGAQLAKIKIIRNEGVENTTQIVNLEKFYQEGDPSILPLLKDGDTIIVPGNPLATNVKVLGSVENPGSYDVFFQTTLLDVIFMAGGPTDDANFNDIKIISIMNRDVQEVKVNIEKLLHSKNFQSIPIVVPGDVVYVAKKKFSWGKFINIIRDISTMAALYYLIIRTSDMQ